jgi:post-segregation antitoxin (ccd killing protein)
MYRTLKARESRAERLNVSVPRELAESVKARAREQNKPVSQYVSELLAADEQRHRDELAAAGYRELAAENLRFAEAAGPLASETWPRWDEGEERDGLPAR